jgi:hypothetical protein
MLLKEEIATGQKVSAEAVIATAAIMALTVATGGVDAVVAGGLLTAMQSVEGVGGTGGKIVVEYVKTVRGKAITYGVGKAGDALENAAQTAPPARDRPEELTVAALVAAAHVQRRAVWLQVQNDLVEFELNARTGRIPRKALLETPVIEPMNNTLAEINAWERRQRLIQETVMWAILYGFDGNSRLGPTGEWRNDDSGQNRPTPSKELAAYWYAQLGPLIDHMQREGPGLRMIRDRRPRDPEHDSVPRKHALVQALINQIGEFAIEALKKAQAAP